MATGKKISDLSVYEYQSGDRVLFPISINGSTKAMTVGQILSLFNNYEADELQNQHINANAEAIAELTYLISNPDNAESLSYILTQEKNVNAEQQESINKLINAINIIENQSLWKNY